MKGRFEYAVMWWKFIRPSGSISFDIGDFRLKKRPQVSVTLTIQDPPCNWGGCWTPRFSRGPQGQAPKKLFAKSMSALQTRMLPSTKSRTFHRKNIWQGKIIFSTKSITSQIESIKKNMLGNYSILYRIKVIPSYHLSPLHNQDLKIWHWGACFTRKSKTLGYRQPYVYKISSLTKM